MDKAQEKIANYIEAETKGGYLQDWDEAVSLMTQKQQRDYFLILGKHILGIIKQLSDRSELREKIRQIEKERATYPIAHPIEEYLDQILALIIPKDKPLLLSDEVVLDKNLAEQIFAQICGIRMREPTSYQSALDNSYKRLKAILRPSPKGSRY